MIALVLALAAMSAPGDVLVNRYATVQSDDGYLNLRPEASTEFAPVQRLDSGTRVLVLTCDSAWQGRRWCHVRTEAEVSGYVYDAELDYAPPGPVRPARGGVAGFGTVAGAGVAPGLRAVDDEALVVSEDGYLNLRAGPSVAHGVLHRLPADALLWVYACRGEAAGPRWCFAEALDERLFGYVYDRELAYFGHDAHEDHDH